MTEVFKANAGEMCMRVGRASVCAVGNIINWVESMLMAASQRDIFAARFSYVPLLWANCSSPFKRAAKKQQGQLPSRHNGDVK